MQLIISKNKIVRLFGTVCMGVFFLQNIAIGAQNSLELHSGIVKLIRNEKSMILQKQVKRIHCWQMTVYKPEKIHKSQCT